MDARAPRRFTGVEDCVEATFSKVGRRVTLCTPIGVGKPVALLNAFYRRAVADRRIELAILTGLTLARPTPASELERRLVEPISAKVYGDAPEPEWIAPLRASRLPPNVRVQEFFMEPGAWLGSPLAQQSYASINYTHVARSVMAEGANVLAQQVALRPGGRLSLGTNPDVTADLVPLLRERERAGTPVALVAQANDRMPFMFGAAEQPEAAFDFLVDDPDGYHELIAPPNLPIPTAEHAIALAASMLMRDGGTIQIGIGELGDAIVHAMTLRHRQNAEWRRALADVGLLPRFAAEQQAMGGDGPFEQGLYAVTEMFVDGFLDLYRAGILKRRAGPGGAVLHGAFLLGPRAFYEALRAMPDEERALFRMMPVSFTNELLGPGFQSKIDDRRDARFVNSAMMATLGGALVSDGLEDGRVVSGVGGQYNFVAQAHELPGGRSIVAVRSTRAAAGGVSSNIRWNYGHETIPRHLRDVVLTEYGIADIRGRSDAEVAAALIAIADSRFQPALLADAKRAGKLPAGWRIPDVHRENLPERLERALAPHRAAGRFGALPFGTDLSPEELRLAGALRKLKARSGSLAGKLGIAAALARPLPRDAESRALFARMGLEQPRGMKERLYRRLVAAALKGD
ncbi:MAG TPA: acetyl-CoA hydrolase/transferase C-terminal domain-containing protein [Steroidobacteraceae bacterium]|jgi:acyl-CoA hydrolase|nr:acetyl-CoA hydrolase/transferase C-terminal domain-containing protein [Steroidobacteraceae bacterium]